jgi:hypothetical protein
MCCATQLLCIAVLTVLIVAVIAAASMVQLVRVVDEARKNHGERVYAFSDSF